MRRFGPRTVLLNALVAAAAVLSVGARLTPEPAKPGPVISAALGFARGGAGVTARPAAGAGVAVRDSATGSTGDAAGRGLSTEAATALATLGASVGELSHPRALEDAFRSYFAYRAAHPGARLKPYLYFVDYGLPSTARRGYVFDMAALRVVDGPFTVAHGRGSSSPRDLVPRRFSNRHGAATTSLGLYVAQELYAFRGHASGQLYHSTGLRLAGVSGAFNNNARSRGVVAHGAPYVTASRAGRSEGCPAMEQARAARLLPKLANGGLVFLFAPEPSWAARDPWVAGAGRAG